MSAKQLLAFFYRHQKSLRLDTALLMARDFGFRLRVEIVEP